MAKNKTIYTVHADSNRSRHLWIKDESPSRAQIGRMVSDKVFFSELFHQIPKKVVDKISDWSMTYLVACFNAIQDGKIKDPEIDWKQFNKEGMAIAKGLKKALGDDVVVQYLKSKFDPSKDSVPRVIE